MWNGITGLCASVFENFITVSMYRSLREGVCFLFGFLQIWLHHFICSPKVNRTSHLSLTFYQKIAKPLVVCMARFFLSGCTRYGSQLLKNQRDKGMQTTGISNQSSLLGRTPNSALMLQARKEWGVIHYLRQYEKCALVACAQKYAVSL